MTTTAPTTVLWIDHKEAKIFSVEAGTGQKILATPPDEEEHRPNKPTASGRRDEHVHERYYAAVLQALQNVGPLLLCGPSTAKLEFSRYLKKQAPKIEKLVVGVETVDHPTDRQLIAFARRFFENLAR